MCRIPFACAVISQHLKCDKSFRSERWWRHRFWFMIKVSKRKQTTRVYWHRDSTFIKETSNTVSMSFSSHLLLFPPTCNRRTFTTFVYARTEARWLDSSSHFNSLMKSTRQLFMPKGKLSINKKFLGKMKIPSTHDIIQPKQLHGAPTRNVTWITN